jgi:hypothetical protein
MITPFFTVLVTFAPGFEPGTVPEISFGVAVPISEMAHTEMPGL